MSRRKLFTLAALGTVLTMVVGAAAWTLFENHLDFHEERVTIPGPHGELHGVLATPSDSPEPYGLVVFVHGDGPSNADGNEAYLPLWDSFADAGFASLSWDKPGVDGAPGNWLDQSMRDRAAEVDAAMAWANTREDIDTTRIGAWGIGQAGWVLPKVARARPDLRFMTLVGPAVDWREQTKFHMRSELKADEASADEVSAAVRRRTERRRLLTTGASYQEYRRARVDPDPITADRWEFLLRNHRSDATASLAHIRTPTLLVVGGRDRNVDVARIEKVYREQMHPGTLTVKQFPEGTHSMMRDDIEYRSGDIRVTGRKTLAPKSIYVPGYLETLRVFAKRETA